MLDGMIMVGASAVVFAVARSYNSFGEEPIYLIHRLGGCILMAASVSVLIFRLRRPRPSIRRIVRQPGPLACFAVVAVQAAYVADTLLANVFDLVRFIGPTPGEWIWLLLGDFGNSSAAVVPVAWAWLALGRLGRIEPGWIDRAGRVLGWAWIAWWLVGPVLPWIERSLNPNPPMRTIM